MSVKVIRELADKEWEELAEGIHSLKHSDGFPQLILLLERVEQLAKECAIDGEASQLLLHRGWRDCASYLLAQLHALPELVEARRELQRAEESPEAPTGVNLMALAGGEGNL